MRFTVGQTIGRYVIESLLGEGGMGEVYRARDSKLERSVALKVLRNDADGASEDWEHAVMRMQREAKAVAALSHPGIVAIYDIGEHEGAPFIAMELVGGQPLRDLVGTDTPFGTRLRILLDVAKALGAAHEAGFVHRDIKPENILVRRDGVPKILDFGIARKTSLHVDHVAQTLDHQGAMIDAALGGMTADGAIVGTPAYMSPEQLRGETADARSDQFAWGVVAYELLSGKHPFQAEKGAIGLIAAVLSEAPAPLAGVSEGIATIVMRALEKEPAERWSSMQEVVMHCEAFITDGDARKVPTGPRPEINVSPGQTASASTPRASRARRLIAPVVGAAILMVVVAFGFRARQAPTTPMVRPLAIPKATPTAVTDLPPPASTNGTAIAEFRQGLQNIRDARWTAAAAAFHQARHADPGMALAHLRYSIIQFSYDVTSAREAYRKAHGLRTSMSERDQGFLHAFEPMMLREPSDYVEAAARMQALAARFPLDAELVFWHSRLIYHHTWAKDELKRVIELTNRCLELDPQYADCWQTKASALLMSDKRDEATKTLDECIRVSENGVDCILDKIEIESHLGHCNEVVQLARRLKTKDPLAVYASTTLAEALYFNGESDLVVRTAFGEAERRARELGRDFVARQALFMSAVDFGDFAEAIGHADFMAHKMTIPNGEMESGLYVLRAALYSEIGKNAEALAVADEFFVARALHPNTSKKLQVEPTMLMHAIRMREGKLAANEYRKLRTEWLDKQPGGTEFDQSIRWLAAYAVPAISTDLAKEALETMPEAVRDQSSDGGRFSKPFASQRGRALILVGKHAEAIPFLEDATRLCTSDDISLMHTQNIAFLGIAREATSDKPGACGAYEKVLSRWGKSKESRTVKDVTKRARRLGCATSADQ